MKGRDAPTTPGFRPAIALLLLAIAPACADHAPATPVDRVSRLELVEGADQTGLAGVPLRDSIVVVVQGDDGPIPGVSVTWAALGPGSLDVTSTRSDSRGRAAVLLTPGEGDDSIRVTAGGLAEMVRAHGATAAPGSRHIGRNGYVDYEAGSLPIIISAPHGGRLEPFEIPDRTVGVTVSDRNTDQVAEALAHAIEARLGARPHLIVSRLHRRKLDPNREIVEAAQGRPPAEHAWQEFHGMIEHARDRVASQHGRGLYLDLHGHGHPIQRLELGYLLDASDLSRSDAELDQGSWATNSSIRTLVAESGAPFSAVLRGPASFGSLLAELGYAATPSDVQPDPGPNPFFSGGYNTARHGSRSGGPISGIQVEAQFTGLRDTEASRASYAAALAAAVEGYIHRWFD